MELEAHNIYSQPQIYSQSTEWMLSVEIYSNHLADPRYSVFQWICHLEEK